MLRVSSEVDGKAQFIELWDEPFIVKGIPLRLMFTGKLDKGLYLKFLSSFLLRSQWVYPDVALINRISLVLIELSLCFLTILIVLRSFVSEVLCFYTGECFMNNSIIPTILIVFIDFFSKIEFFKSNQVIENKIALLRRLKVTKYWTRE